MIIALLIGSEHLRTCLQAAAKLSKYNRGIVGEQEFSMAIEKLYSVSEAAEALGISYWTVWAKLKSGELLRTKVGGRTVIRESELKKLIVDQPRKAK